MIQNWWVLFFNSVYEDATGSWQVCTECGDCNQCEGCIKCSDECPDCPSIDKYIFWVATAQPGWSCEIERDPYCETGTPLWTCEKRGETGGCLTEFWDWHIDLVCGGIGQQGYTHKITNIGYTTKGFWRKKLEPPPSPHPCQCLPADKCGDNFFYDQDTAPGEVWNWRMPCNGPCNAGCSDCGSQWCYYWQGDPSPGCSQDCRCAFGEGSGPSYQNYHNELVGPHVVATSTKYRLTPFLSCDPTWIETYPNDNGSDVIIGNDPVNGIPCQDYPLGGCSSNGISNFNPRGFADENGEFLWEDMKFAGYQASTYELDENNNVVIACPGTRFYEVEANCRCGETRAGDDGCGAGCACGDPNCGANGKFLYYRHATESTVTFTQIGKVTKRPNCTVPTGSISLEDQYALGLINEQGGYAVYLEGGVPTEGAPTLTGSSCMDLTPKQFTFECGT